MADGKVVIAVTAQQITSAELASFKGRSQKQEASDAQAVMLDGGGSAALCPLRLTPRPSYLASGPSPPRRGRAAGPRTARQVKQRDLGRRPNLHGGLNNPYPRSRISVSQAALVKSLEVRLDDTVRAPKGQICPAGVHGKLKVDRVVVGQPDSRADETGEASPPQVCALHRCGQIRRE